MGAAPLQRARHLHAHTRALLAWLSDTAAPSGLPPALCGYLSPPWTHRALSPASQSFVDAIRTGRARDIEALLKVGAVDGTSGMLSRLPTQHLHINFCKSALQSECERMCTCHNWRGGEPSVSVLLQS